MADSELTTVNAGEMSAAGQQFNWVGLNPVQIKSVAQAMALSGMFPDVQKDSAKAFVKIMAGQEMGIAPFQAMSDIAIIQGKAAAGGNIHASKVKSSAKYDYKVLEWDRTHAKIEFFEYNPKTQQHDKSIGISEFNEQDAKDAQLLGKDSWKKYARNMYFNRAMTAGVRTFCPDALNGVNAYTPEELGAVVDGDGHVVDYQPERAKPAPAASKKPSKADTAQEAEIVDTKDTIVLIGEELEAKGFSEGDDRKAIALAAAGVKTISQASPEQWVDVLASIKGMSAEELTGLLPQAVEEPEQPAPAPVVKTAPDPKDKGVNSVQVKLLLRRTKLASGRETEIGIREFFEENFGMTVEEVRQSEYEDVLNDLTNQIADKQREDAELQPGDGEATA